MNSISNDINESGSGVEETPQHIKILVVEDDDNLRLAVSDNLEDEGYDVMSTRTGAKASDYVARYKIDLIVLDINLPDTDGFTLCKQWRDNGVQSMILMLTARDQEDDMVKGFSAGADDYIVKPYQLRVFLSRVAALLRRAERKIENKREKSFDLPGYSINADARLVTSVSGDVIDFTKIEFDLLLFMINNQNCALTYEKILETVWGDGVVVVQGAIRNTVSSLRKKLDSKEHDNWRIVTLRGIGYRFEMDE